VPELKAILLTAVPKLQPSLEEEYVPFWIVIAPCMADSAVAIAVGIDVAQTGFTLGEVNPNPRTP
jgi:hypothetical protein